MEYVFDLFLVALFSGFLFMSRGITEKSIANDNLGSQGFPQLIAIVAIVLLVTILGKTVITRKKVGYAKSQKIKSPEGTKQLYIRIFLLVMVLFLYIIFLKKLGFTLETILFIFTALTILGYRNYRISALFAVAFTAILVIIFGRVFFIAIPRGTGFLKELSYFIY